MLISMLKYKIT